MIASFHRCHYPPPPFFFPCTSGNIYTIISFFFSCGKSKRLRQNKRIQQIRSSRDTGTLFPTNFRGPRIPGKPIMMMMMILILMMTATIPQWTESNASIRSEPVIADASSSDAPGVNHAAWGQAACQSAACPQKRSSGLDV